MIDLEKLEENFQRFKNKFKNKTKYLKEIELQNFNLKQEKSSSES